jgi:camphor 5-monooxygenase
MSLSNLAPLPSHIPPERVVDFDMYNPSGMAEAGPHEAWRRLRDGSKFDLVWTTRNDGHWIALREQYVRKVYRDVEHFGSRVIQPPVSEGLDSKLVPTHKDLPEHTPFREILNKAVGMTAAKNWDGRIRKVAGEVIDELVSRGGCDYVADYAKPFVFRLILSTMDLPIEDGPKLSNLIGQFTRPDGSMTMAQVFEKFFDYIDPIAVERIGRDGDDIISVAVNCLVDGRPMTRDERCGLVSVLIVGGLDTVINMSSFYMEFLARNPAHCKQLADNPSLIPKAIEEFIRRFPVLAEGRLVKKETELDGVPLKVGDFVLAPSVLAGLDDRANKCPMDVDFSRKKISQVSFGDGPHICAGQYFARQEMKITLEEWFKRIPEFEIAPQSRVKYGAGTVLAVETLPLVWKGAKQ